MGKYFEDGVSIRGRGMLIEKRDAKENLVKLKFILGIHVLEITIFFSLSEVGIFNQEYMSTLFGLGGLLKLCPKLPN